MSKKYENDSEDNTYNKVKREKGALTEIAYNTCFSTEQEEIFKKKSKFERAANLLKKSFMPPGKYSKCNK